MSILSHTSHLAFNYNTMYIIVIFSIPCTIGIYYGYLMTFKTDRCLKEKEFNLGYWLHNGSPNIAPSLRRMAQSKIWQNQHSPDSQSKTRKMGIFVLCASIIAELFILTISFITM